MSKRKDSGACRSGPTKDWLKARRQPGGLRTPVVSKLQAALDRACRELKICPADKESHTQVAQAILAISKVGQLDVEQLANYAVYNYRFPPTLRPAITSPAGKLVLERKISGEHLAGSAPEMPVADRAIKHGGELTVRCPRVTTYGAVMKCLGRSMV